MSDAKSYKEAWKEIEKHHSGGQGSTIKSHANGSTETVIVKTLHSQKDIERRKRMHREAVALATLDHIGLPKVLDTNTGHFDDIDYKLFIILDYIEGKTLSGSDFKNVGLADKVTLLLKISEVVAYCHGRGIIHRDIKPDNIILRNGNICDPVVVDFGLSFNSTAEDDDTLTSIGQHIGNRFLILPEQKIGEAGKRDYRSDVTCIVGIFFYVITGLHPTICIDEHNQQPHQRKGAKEIIDAFPEHQKNLINNIFDVGFSQLIDRRWQTVQSLMVQFSLLEKSKPIDLMENKNIVEEIKRKAASGAYQDNKMGHQLLEEMMKRMKLVIDEISRELGSEWTSRVYGITEPYFRNGIFQTSIVPYNKAMNVKLDTNVKAFITGSEFVIQIIENGMSQEVFRQPILNMQWEQFDTVLKKHYLLEISKKM